MIGKSDQERVARFAWLVLGLNLLVILWGAYVRASGSGAGCGAHWPTCQGEVIPPSPTIATLIEYTHRLSSGLALIGVIALFWQVWRHFPSGSAVRRAAAWSLLFIVTEALVGASLVLLQYVAMNPSVGRAVVMAIHLNNTFLLLAALTVTALLASNQPHGAICGRGRYTTLIVLVGVLLMVVATAGAVTALGDTLFPSATLREGMAQDLSSTAHLFVRLRVIHPILALVAFGLAGWVSRKLRSANESLQVARYACLFSALMGTQIVLGFLNLFLRAPIALQLLHLATADAIWIVFVLLAVTFAGHEDRRTARQT